MRLLIGTKIGEYEIVSPYAADVSKIGIRRANGEGGDFDRNALEKHLAAALEQFYRENF